MARMAQHATTRALQTLPPALVCGSGRNTNRMSESGAPETAVNSIVLPRDVGVFAIRDCRHGVMAYLRADATIGRALDLYGEFAESENRLMAAFINPGDTVIDVGANVGTVALALARGVGPSGRVLAFEPQRLVFQALCATLTMNGLTHVEARRQAVGRVPGAIRIPAIDPTVEQNLGSIRIDPVPNGAAPNGGAAAGDLVPLVTIDELSLAACALLKIDAEGMDYDVLLGAKETIARARPVLYFEGHAGGETVRAITFARDRKYRCHWHFAAFYEADSFRKAPNVFGSTGDVNVLAIPEEHALGVTLPPISAPGADWKRDYTSFLTERQPGR
jgi:FkbM family methyltransferase